jgi:hypothetical protein
MALDSAAHNRESRLVHGATNGDDASLDHRSRVWEGISPDNDDVALHASFDDDIALQDDDRS